MATITVLEHKTILLGITDEYGREICAIVSVSRATIDKPGDSWPANVKEPGTYIVVRVQAGRNGEPYGAHTPSKTFPNGVAADDIRVTGHVALKVEQMRQRYLKKYRAVGGAS